MQAFILFFGGWILATILHSTALALLAVLVGSRLRTFAIFIGPRLVALKVGEIDVGINALPLGNVVHLKSALPPLWRAAVLVGANTVVLLIAAIAMGPEGSAFGLFGFFWLDALTGGALPLDSADSRALFAAVRAFIEVTPTATALGAVAVFATVLNLLPIPALDGGQIIIAVLETYRPLTPATKARLELAGQVILLSLVVGWTYQFVKFIVYDSILLKLGG